MRVRIVEKKFPLTTASATWFSGRLGEEFCVLSVFDSNEKLYKVDVRHPNNRGDMQIKEAFLPASFVEEIEEIND